MNSLFFDMIPPSTKLESEVKTMAYDKGHWEVRRVRVRGGSAYRWWGRVSKQHAMEFPPEERRYFKDLIAYTDETCTARK